MRSPCVCSPAPRATSRRPIAGYFLIRASIDARPANAAGLDTALTQVHHQPFGTVLLLIVAAGMLVFATFSLFEARYQRL